jgi:hypothetical protein
MWWSLTALAAVSSFMMLPVSRVFWRHLPALRFVQFPWRWLFPLALSVSLLTAAVFTSLHRKWAAWLAVGCALFVLDGRIADVVQNLPAVDPGISRLGLGVEYLVGAVARRRGLKTVRDYRFTAGHVKSRGYEGAGLALKCHARFFLEYHVHASV